MQGSDAHERILAAASATENTEALLWKIEHGDRPPSYLFGTVHLTDERISEHSPVLLAALGASRQLVLEIDDFSPDSFLKAFARAREQIMFTDRRRLDQLLTGEEYSKVAGILQRSGFPPEVAGAVRPWVASLLMALSDCEQARMRTGLLSLDAKLARHAQSLGIGVAGLETVELQLRAMAGVPEADQIAILKAALRTYDRIDDIIETTVQLYLGRQTGAIWPLQLVLAEQVGVAPEAFDFPRAKPARDPQHRHARQRRAASGRGRRLHRCRRPASAGAARPRRIAARGRLHRHGRRVGVHRPTLHETSSPIGCGTRLRRPSGVARARVRRHCRCERSIARSWRGR